MHSNYFLTEVSCSRRECHTAQECPRKLKPQDLQGPSFFKAIDTASIAGKMGLSLLELPPGQIVQGL